MIKIKVTITWWIFWVQLSREGIQKPLLEYGYRTMNNSLCGVYTEMQPATVVQDDFDTFDNVHIIYNLKVKFQNKRAAH